MCDSLVCSKRRAVDADLYSQQLDGVNEILKQRYAVLVNRNIVTFKQNNVRLHFLRRINFEIIKTVEVYPPNYSHQKPDWYRRGLINFVESFLKTIESDDLYF